MSFAEMHPIRMRTSHATLIWLLRLSGQNLSIWSRSKRTCLGAENIFRARSEPWHHGNAHLVNLAGVVSRVR